MMKLVLRCSCSINKLQTVKMNTRSGNTNKFDVAHSDITLLISVKYVAQDDFFVHQHMV